ncbi:MAG: hypothetical protein J2P30_06120, partial [Actinobacteria bacterium]|nr:hypothetical protein [Actinomycetota bacterium]
PRRRVPPGRPRAAPGHPQLRPVRQGPGVPGRLLSRAGAASSHLAEVARSLGVPMVVGCHPETVTGPGPAAGTWFATIDGGTGEVALTSVRPARG